MAVLLYLAFRDAPAPHWGETSSVGSSLDVGSVWITGCPKCPAGLLVVPLLTGPQWRRWWRAKEL